MSTVVCNILFDSLLFVFAGIPEKTEINMPLIHGSKYNVHRKVEELMNSNNT